MFEQVVYAAVWVLLGAMGTMVIAVVIAALVFWAVDVWKERRGNRH